VYLQGYKTTKQIDPDLNVIAIAGYPDNNLEDHLRSIALSEFAHLDRR
jgi:hypothetical protein